MAGGLLPQPKQLIQDNAWNPGIAYQLYTYEPASLTPKGTHQDQALTIANTNPVVANARGEVVMYGTGSYRIVLKDSLGNTIWDRDNIDALVGGSSLLGATGASLVGYDDTTLDVALKSRLGRVVGSISALRALNKTKNTQAYVTGYYAPGDGGGGAYYYDAADTTTADNSGSVIVAGDGGRWKLAQSSYWSAKQFGAKGDGTTSDSTAIQAATNAAAAAGKVLFFPAGTYRLLSFITWSANTNWQGEPGSIIKLDPTMALGPAIGGIARAIYGSTITGVALAGLTFQSAKTGLTKAITICFDGITNVDIDACTFKDFGDATYYAQGAILFGCVDVRITNSVFTNCSGDGLAFSNIVTNFAVSGCEFSFNLDWGFALSIGCTNGTVQANLFKDNTSTAVGADRCSNIQFIGNTMVNNSHGIRVCKFAPTAEVNRNITIAGNNIINTTITAISIEQCGTNGTGANGLITVTGNTINGVTGQGILILDTTEFAVTGNTIFSTTAEAILCHAQTAGWVTGGGVIAGNKISTCTYGIRQLATGGTASNMTVIGNNIGAASVAATLFPSSILVDYIDGSISANYFDFSKPLNFPSGIVSGSATAGGTPIPVNAQGFLPIYVGGALKKIPYYNA